ncbi:YihY/virulence factor BrkB family protein [Halorientalis salina]|uniref:YihY/virulence factor BrkB family protein n=1 Tax=Halorientalis salina TaxID=2932266 RepID=UPI0010AB9AD7|nr:YihY/virulence factor BrkB family protein [Halorientalis salina]
MPSVPDFESWFSRRWPFGWRVYAESKRVNVQFMANSVAFQTFTALVPLLVVLFVLVATFAGDALADQVLTLTEGFLPDETQTLVATAITRELSATGTSVVSVAFLLWGALNLFKGLDTAFSMIYDTTTSNTRINQTKDALVVFVVLLLAITAAVVAGGTAILTRFPLRELLTPLVLFVGLTVVFLPMYYVFPDVDLSLRAVLPGTLVAAAGWTALESVFRLYVAYAAGVPAGAVGAVLITLAWLYFGSLLLLLGAIVNAVLADDAGRAMSGDSPPDIE